MEVVLYGVGPKWRWSTVEVVLWRWSFEEVVQSGADPLLSWSSVEVVHCGSCPLWG